MRGTGVTPKVLYQWTEQPNGKFTIFDVPILKPFVRELANGKKVVVAAKDYQDIIARFRADRDDIGYYPKVHLGHQDLTSPVNARAVGLLDNMYAQGEMLFADLVEIEKNDFDSIEKYSYRSVEYNAVEKKVETLALLESRSPFILLPLLALAPVPVDLELVDDEKVLSFERRAASLIQLGAVVMADVVEKKKEDKDPAQLAVVESEEHASDEMGKLDSLVSGMQKIADMLGKIAEKLFAGEEEVEEGGAEEPTPIPPQSVAQQSADYRAIEKMMKKQNETIAMLSQQLQQKDAAQSYESKLINLANSNPTLNLESSKKVMAQLSSDADRKIYLDSLAEGCVQFQRHVASSIAKEVKFVQDDLAVHLEKSGYELRPEMVHLARQAQRDYRDTVSQGNKREAERFASVWPDEAGFVRAMVEQELAAPGSYERMS